MKLKIDENLGHSVANLLKQSGHDVATVPGQKLGGAPDDVIFEACVAERRILVTLDRDFGQVRRFPPKRSAGVVIIEIGGPASLRLLHDRLRDFLSLAATRSVAGELWIVEPGRIRVHLEREDDI